MNIKEWLTTTQIEEKYNLATGSIRRDIHRNKFYDDEKMKIGHNWIIHISAIERQYKKGN